MGKRRNQGSNIENISPTLHHKSSSGYLLLTEMKTRSGKASSNEDSSSANVITEASQEIEYPAVQLIQDLAVSANESVTASTSNSQTTNDSTNQASRSPLAESSINEQTPEKSDTTSEVINELLKEAGQISSTTPTTNLKILCEAVVDHDESGTSELSSQEIKTRTDPVTPTANLKMLITAASPEIRSLELSKSRLFAEDEEEDDMEEEDEEPVTTGKRKQSRGPTRKQKSLGILCRRFMAQFEEHPPPTSRIEVCLDELAAHLGTERRRIYDIVNVLESVEMMSRRAKNRYLWHGKTNLNSTLVKLKYLAETEQVAKQLELVRELELTRLYGRKSKTNGFIQSEEEAVSNHPKYKEYMELFGETHRKERSLGVMSQKFLMLFLTGRTKTINLDMAAKLLLGDPMVETKQTNSQFKTKIRRLYDIANILASLNLICKVHVTELRGRKPAFSYIGPDVEELCSLDEYKYLKDVEVIRPGRTTLDMKMEELKKKMEAHVAAEAEANRLRQVPPVTIQGPDMEQIKHNLSSGSSSTTNLSQLAAEHNARKAKSITHKIVKSPCPAATAADHRPFVVIQQKAVGGASVITTSQVPQFMDSQGNEVRMVQLDGNPVLVTAPPGHHSQHTQHRIVSPAPSASATSTPQSGTRRILPQPNKAQQITLYAPPHTPTQTPTHTPTPTHGTKSVVVPATVVTAAEPSHQLKRTASQMEEEHQEEAEIEEEDESALPDNTPTSALVQEADGTFTSYFLTKSDNEYFLINKRLRVEGEEDEDDGSEPQTVIIEQVPEDKIGDLGQAFEIIDTSSSAQQNLTPVPVVYSTPSGQHTITLTTDNQGHAVINPVSSRQISFMTSPIVTPVGTPVDSHTTITTEKQPGVAVRKLTLK